MYVWSENIENINFFFPMKFSNFIVEKILCILHGQIFVMCVLCYMLAVAEKSAGARGGEERTPGVTEHMHRTEGGYLTKVGI